MTRKNINLGTNANDGTGDKLRDAMSKVNDNLIELYERTGGDQTLTGVRIGVVGNVLGISGSMTITTNNAGNLTIAAPTNITSDSFLFGNLRVNTTEVDATNRVIVDGNVKLKGSVILGDGVNFDTITLNSTISSTLIPSINLTYDIGSSSLRYRDAYIGGTGYLQNLYSPNANIVGGHINGTTIGDINPVDGRFLNLRVNEDAFLGNLLVRDNVISTGINNEDIEIRPFGNGNLQVATRVIIGEIANPIGDAILKAIDTVTDSYVQVVLQNLDPGTTSSTDLFIPRDDGNDESNFIDLGINSSAYYNPLEYPIHPPGSAYLYTSDSDLFIGTYTNNDVVLHAGSDADFSSIAMRIKGDTAHIILGPEDGSTITVDTGELLQINGDTRISGNLITQNRTITSSVGEDGDVIGMIAIDSSYIYYCTADYDGSSSIWSRVALSSTPW